jgi:glycosyltransferase involved in cell wall biosynthesis
MKIRYIISMPYCTNPGGTTNYINNILKNLKMTKQEVLPLDYTATIIDFDVLLILSFSYHNPDMIEEFKKQGVKIINIPIYDRTKSKFSYNLYKLVSKLPIQTLYKSRKRQLMASSKVMASCNSEADDMKSIFNINADKIVINHLAIDDDIVQLRSTISEDLFFDKYGIKDFVIFSAAGIGSRKNQILLLKALKDSGIKIVLTGTHRIEKGLEEEFETLTKNNKDVLCLQSLDKDMLISAYKCAKVSISLSNSETAGISLLESAVLGCNIVCTDLEAFKEYLGTFPTYIHSSNLDEIKSKTILALNSEFNTEIISYIENNCSWKRYTEVLNSQF